MKITMYELLGLVKDGKAPQKIKYEYLIYELTSERNDYYCKNEMRWFTNEINSLGLLNDYVEIIEEPKKIEKLELVRGSDLSDLTDKDMVLKNNALIELCKTLNNMNNKINELIDTVNELKRNK